MISFLKRPALPATLALCLLSPTFHARAAASDTNSLFSDPVFATGKGFEIKRSQVDDAYLNYTAAIAARGGTVPEADRAEVRSNLLDHLIVNKILLQMATAEERTQTKEQVDGAFADARAHAPSAEAFEQQIKASGMTLEQLRAQAIEEQLCRRVILRETTNHITVTDAEVKKFYEDNPAKFEVPEQARAAHVLISTLDPLTHEPLPADKKKEKEKLANDLRARALKGEDFAALAKQYSEDPGSKDKGGEYTFPRGRMVPEFEAAAFSLKTNQISELVETQYGYHIIKLLEKTPASKITLAKASPSIHEFLVGQAVKEELPAYTAKLKAGAEVKLTDAAAASAGTGRK
jgi:peptidyl-prolyl cis-trans isomerase C